MLIPNVREDAAGEMELSGLRAKSKILSDVETRTQNAVKKLQQRLQQAIETEDYEQAEIVRRQIPILTENTN